MGLFGLWKKKSEEPEKGTGIIGRYYEDEFPVIVKFDSDLPEELEMKRRSMLTIVSWKYDGVSNNGMPLEDDNSKMILLEDALEGASDDSKVFEHAYSRTGNNLKELVYYSTSQDEFLGGLNSALSKHERFPIEINFYEDSDWSELKKLIEDFTKK